MTTTVVLVHAASTWFLTGLIWLVQVVHYPLFAQVGDRAFPGYRTAHASRITAVLGLPWAAQGLTAAWLLVARPPGVPTWLVWATAALAVVPVAVTVALSIPAHTHLEAGFDAGIHRRLVTTNWLRTAAWTTHAVLCLPLLTTALRPTAG